MEAFVEISGDNVECLCGMLAAKTTQVAKDQFLPSRTSQSSENTNTANNDERLILKNSKCFIVMSLSSDSYYGMGLEVGAIILILQRNKVKMCCLSHLVFLSLCFVIYKMKLKCLITEF